MNNQTLLTELTPKQEEKITGGVNIRFPGPPWWWPKNKFWV